MFLVVGPWRGDIGIVGEVRGGIEMTVRGIRAIETKERGAGTEEKGNGGTKKTRGGCVTARGGMVKAREAIAKAKGDIAEVREGIETAKGVIEIAKGPTETGEQATWRSIDTCPGTAAKAPGSGRGDSECHDRQVPACFANNGRKPSLLYDRVPFRFQKTEMRFAVSGLDF